MIRQPTIDRLHEMWLSAMADAFENQCADAEIYQNLSFEDRFVCWSTLNGRSIKNSKLQKLIHNAGFRYPHASVEAIEYYPDRKLDKGQRLEFLTYRYIADDYHIILKGAFGNGKTYIAYALGIAECRNFIKICYIRVPDFLNELAIAHGEATLKTVINAYQKIDLLILDEFLLRSVFSEQTRELLEIIEARSINGFVISCTQFEPVDWYNRIGNECAATICEAIVDRIVHNSYQVMIGGRVSVRERHGIKVSPKGASNE